MSLSRPNRSPRTSAKIAAVIVTFAGAGLVTGLVMTSDNDLAPLPEMVAAQLTDTGAQAFVQVHETTIEEWNRCYVQGGCALQLRPPQNSKAQDFPATGINWMDAQDYVRWISHATGHPFRLPTSKEWDKMARDVMPETPDPIFTDPTLTWASAYQLEEGVDRRLRPSGSWATTADGIADLNGNVWEWTQDCYDGATDTTLEMPCAAYVLGGEHRSVVSFLVRDPARGGCAVGAPPAHLGFRLVTDRNPHT